MFELLGLTRMMRHRRQRRKKYAKRRRMGDAPDYLKQLLQASKPGQAKMELPYTIPPIETVIELDDNTTKTIKVAAISLGVGIAIGGIANAAGRIYSK